MQHRTSVVILNWNNRNFLEQFLPKIIRHSEDYAQIVVADNASTDGSIDFLEKNFPSVRIIRIDSNRGYTGGYNLALSQIDSEYFVLLNSDIEVTENWLDPLIRFMDDHPDTGACQPKILSFYSRESFEYAGGAGGYIDRFGYPFCRGRIFNSLETDLHQYDDTRPVFWASGSCMMVRSAVFNELKGFDNDFFAHMEEIDLCWRMQLAGYKIYYCPLSSVFHVGGGTLPKSNPKKTYLNFRNNLFMIYKNSTSSNSRTILRYRMLLDLVASVKFLFSGSFRDFKAVWLAWRDFISLKSRYSRRVSDNDLLIKNSGNLIYPKCILWDYYLYGVKKFSALNWKRPGGDSQNL